MNKQAAQLLDKHFETALDTPDGIKKLRELILTLGMQGKLVPQDPKDQPASELLREIEANKLRLTKEGKVKYREFSISIEDHKNLYTIPNNWCWSHLADIGEINPRNISDDNVIAGFVPMSLIFSEYGKDHEFEQKTWLEIKKGFTHFQNNDLVMAKITPCFENGKSCIIKNLPNNIGAGTTELHVFRSINEQIYPEYVLAFLKNPLFFQLAIPKMTGSAGQKRISTDFFQLYHFHFRQ